MSYSTMYQLVTTKNISEGMVGIVFLKNLKRSMLRVCLCLYNNNKCVCV